jgi:hypothetical protein
MLRWRRLALLTDAPAALCFLVTEIPLWFKEGEVINIDSTQWPHHVGLYLYDTKQA